MAFKYPLRSHASRFPKQVSRRTEEGRKPVLFGNREKNKEELLNRKRRVDKETVVLSVHMGG